MDLVHITSYVDEETFRKMEELRKARVRQTRSQWVNEAIAEKLAREIERFAEPTQQPTKNHS